MFNGIKPDLIILGSSMVIKFLSVLLWLYRYRDHSPIENVWNIIAKDWIIFLS